MNILRFAVITAFFTVLPFSHISASAASDQEIEALKKEIQVMKSEYENRILKMEQKLTEMETQASQPKTTYSKSTKKASSGRAIYNSDLNPSIGAILGGRFAAFSSDEGEIPGFVLGHEGERGAEGISLGETELNISTSVDDKFYGHITTALADHGDGVEIELEEAYVETLPGSGLPTGATIKMGRAFWTLGYMNEHHAHGDDFADRPLPYRVFLDKSFNDTGAEISYVFPTDFYLEAGGGVFRGDDFPFAGADGNDINSFSAFMRVGGDIGGNSSWRIGGYLLDGEASGRGGGHGHGHDDEHGHDDDHENGDEHAGENGHDDHDDDHHADENGHDEEHDEHGHDDDHGENLEEFFSAGMFTGDTRLYAIDFRYVWAPTGNNRQKEVLLQGEYFWRDEEGVYTLEEETETLDGGSSGWYAQGVFKFSPKWRIGARYSQLYSPEDSGIDHDPYTVAVMGDWSNSEFSRIRLQYNYEKLGDDLSDNQFLVQYIMSVGAHAAHKY
ncbi:MAG: hypothetical protein OXF23_03255 [Candidatus Dadabacteria bacterium]|nr:hypothetical protein [Candidatus Dadabacteria bacterium]